MIIYASHVYMGDRRINELEHIMHSVEDQAKEQVEDATARLHEKTSEASSYKLENERLKVSFSQRKINIK